jgi:hypothetical protein
MEVIAQDGDTGGSRIVHAGLAILAIDVRGGLQLMHGRNAKLQTLKILAG